MLSIFSANLDTLTDFSQHLILAWQNTEFINQILGILCTVLCWCWHNFRCKIKLPFPIRQHRLKHGCLSLLMELVERYWIMLTFKLTESQQEKNQWHFLCPVELLNRPHSSRETHCEITVVAVGFPVKKCASSGKGAPFLTIPDLEMLSRQWLIFAMAVEVSGYKVCVSLKC